LWQGGGAARPGFEGHAACFDPFRKFSILLDSSTTSLICVSTRSEWIPRVLSIELSRVFSHQLRAMLSPFGIKWSLLICPSKRQREISRAAGLSHPV
jgi:hypothetical protein